MTQGDSSWRDTLFVWDGILTAKDETDLAWEGTWVGCEKSPDAKTIEAPKRGAFDEFVTSDMKFDVKGTTEKISKEGNEYYKASLVDGSGWDLKDGDETKKHKDEVHNVLLPNLKWTGNLNDQRNNIVFAVGKNDSGSFISAGWMRPGNRLTLGRRYLQDNDARAKWDIEKLREEVLREVYDAGLNKVRIPPWQCDVLHAQPQESKKRAREEEEEAKEAPKPKQAATANA